MAFLELMGGISGLAYRRSTQTAGANCVFECVCECVWVWVCVCSLPGWPTCLTEVSLQKLMKGLTLETQWEMNLLMCHFFSIGYVSDLEW